MPVDFYRKKPVVIEAIKFEDNPECLTDLSDMGLDPVHVDYSVDPPVLKIETLEGTMEGNVGDWIIKGVKGEFYPCKPDIFEATYDLASSVPESVPDLPTFEWNGDEIEELSAFCGADCTVLPELNGRVTILTKEGNVYAEVGDSIVRHADGILSIATLIESPEHPEKRTRGKKKAK